MTEPDALWAPWRLEYVERPSGGSCVLCAEAERADREGLVLARGATCFVVLNRFPYASGHLLILPLRHEADPLALTEEERLEMDLLEQRCLRVLGETARPDGYNIGMNVGPAAGQGVAGHLHVHVVPRFESDTNFMPVVGLTRVLPEHLLDTWDRMRPHFDAASTRVED